MVPGNVNKGLFDSPNSTSSPGGLLAGGFIALAKPPSNNLVEYNIYSTVMIVVIYHLIKNKYFDVIIKLIEMAANNGTELTDPMGKSSISGSNGEWTASKIYAFFEGLYINENIRSE